MTIERRELPGRVDVAVVGAGFSGMYLVKLMREAGFSVAVIEAADDVGGTWWWNRYPGARCDIESVQYAHSYLPELEQDWDWSERYATQPEILAYAGEIADRLDLRRDMYFGRRVERAAYDEAGREWRLRCDTGEALAARFCIMATGCLSAPNRPSFPGQERFGGPIYHTGTWPHAPVDFSGQRVAVIGTGSSGIQTIPQVAKQAAALTVFQRTPNYAVPARNHALSDADRAAVKAGYAELRARQKASFSGAYYDVDPEATGAGMTPAARDAMLERRWGEGGLVFAGVFPDQMYERQVNDHAAGFVRDKIRAKVRDPQVAELLCPSNTIGAKRLCVDIGYFETFNQDHVTLVDVSEAPVEITSQGVSAGGEEYEVDAIICATGFDAMTGALLRMDIEGRGGRRLAEHWRQGPSTYLGLAVAGFPNLFTVTGPQSPSVFTNVTQAIEQHCEWIAGCLRALRAQGAVEIEADPEAERAWGAHNAEVASRHLRSSTASWYTGENISGKPVGFMPYIGGFATYAAKCDAVAQAGYEGFRLV
ncbi:Cyclohexanone monooxygenase [Candidatus Rhodobacter oscarellae]|uniref:Cyclohexanone monooxygenase n=1 Tax=Candidatus Rhodobacter oscarellae TaxID=1675527 RepID=A0A0J9E093_9RHOB|nr:NAD(P)/FAD-dependent oxidoreductase [Candidatus Rhodobacter lobularis]KMW56072.1 Cyclohexanone monooxygenase [Candidatus Rhodobacter lobularis]